MVTRIIEAASSAPMGIPPSDVRVLDGFDRVRGFRDDLLVKLKTWKWMSTRRGQILMRPFVSRITLDVMRGFVASRASS
jgi:hypothetical protein